MEGINPQSYELPQYVRRVFRDVVRLPSNGQYTDLQEYDVTKMEIGSKALKANRGSIKSLCYHCAESSLKGQLIQCDFCHLWWHLHCVDPPLTSIPNNGVIWLDAADSSAVVREAGIRLGGSSNDVDSGELTDSGSSPAYGDVVGLRKKWMCPCHSQHVQQKRRHTVRGDKIITANDRPSKERWNDGNVDIINTEPEWAYGSEGVRKRSIDKDLWSLGDCTEFTIDNVRYRVPERRVKLEFFGKALSMSDGGAINLGVEEDPLARFSDSTPTPYYTRIEELYPPSDRILESTPLVDSSNVSPFREEDDVEVWLTGLAAFQADIARHLRKRRLNAAPRKMEFDQLVQTAQSELERESHAKTDE
ncbi:hypothetical protein M427DRAFT_331943 [Gonapodya prolifera JEL478]|uniref:Zinc finger PHD-type domain-containing protein n=1 Tax=Gonapodya prolifera (strain JEL478) TaxID=1344416 RepID=A0A139AE88_GONPJ|nr:hypothetical protein M427DRAFT_331943 [Gonapodya prolifera JEL478]|eukprot:KXS14904.1 hypothetical protein M427DRAFT_331943 [Gonapodya prolifera JEL478]